MCHGETMPQRRTRKGSQSSDGQEEGQPSREQRSMMLQRKKELFIQQFEKEAQARLNEMESNLQQLLATVDRAFKVLIMKSPQSLLNTLLKDVLADDDPVGEVTIAVGAQSPEMLKPLTRKPSKKGMSEAATLKTTQNKRATGGPEKRRGTTRSMEVSDGRPLRCATTASAKRTQSRFANLGDQSRPKAIRSIARSISDDLSIGKVLPSNVAVITTSQGETLLLSEETKDDFNLAKVDDVAIIHMERLRDLINHFCNKVKTI
ncbi:borealin-2 [Alosa sapidissima]|uniref:borealin-2 n=1 Tax=Alosa sapidissima TaxID=34773 RepID=UPI001C08FC2E|nr:borealin-2 [Alosa sapidissima]